MGIATKIILVMLLAASAAQAGWSEPVRLSIPGAHETPVIQVRGDTVLVVSKNYGPPDRIAYYRSTNDGATWSGVGVLSDDSCQVTFPRIIANGDSLMVLWRNYFYRGIYRLNIGYATSTNNGRSWSAPRYVFSQNREHSFFFAASGSNSRVNIVFSSIVDDTLTGFYGIRSTDFGRSWSAASEIFRTLQSGRPDLIANDSIVHFSWAGCFNINDPWEVYYIRSTDGGISWSPNITLSDSDQYHSQLPSIYIDSFDKIEICWMDYKYSPYMGAGDILIRHSTDYGSSWGPEEQATFDHFAWTSDVASNGDTIHIVWRDEAAGLANGSIYYTRSTDNGESWSEPYWIDANPYDSDDPSIAGSDGKVYVVWTDSRPNTDTSLCCGLYFSRYDPEPDAVQENDIGNMPDKISLSAYPNPFNSSTTISTDLDIPITIYDITGRCVAVLHSEQGQAIWDASGYSSGIYFARVAREDISKSVKLILLK